MRLDDQIDHFFAPPDSVQEGPRVSALYLLRREIQDCFFGQIVVPEENALLSEPRHRIFATCLVLCSGLDLLAKFYTGATSTKGGVSERFRKFAVRFLFAGDPQAETLAKVLYLGCRNPMVHSFSVKSAETFTCFVTTWSPGMKGNPAFILAAVTPGLYVLSVEGLFVGFLRAVRSYRAELNADETLRRHFSEVFPRLGTMGVAAGESEDRHG